MGDVLLRDTDAHLKQVDTHFDELVRGIREIDGDVHDHGLDDAEEDETEEIEKLREMIRIAHDAWTVQQNHDVSLVPSVLCLDPDACEETSCCSSITHDAENEITSLSWRDHFVREARPFMLAIVVGTVSYCIQSVVAGNAVPAGDFSSFDEDGRMWETHANSLQRLG